MTMRIEITRDDGLRQVATWSVFVDHAAEWSVMTGRDAFTKAELRAMRDRLQRGETVEIGGGAAPRFVLRLNVDAYTVRHLDAWLDCQINGDATRAAARAAMLAFISDDPEYWSAQSWWNVFDRAKCGDVVARLG